MNPIEERIAKAFQEARIRDGKVTPSVAAQIVELCHIKGLTVEDVISGKTPQGISVLWMHRRISGHPTPVHDELDGRRYPLLPFSLLVHDAIKHNQEAAQWWTFPILLRVKENEIDAERLSAAMETAISNHPVFAMRITEDGMQQHEQGYRTPYLKARVYSEDGYVYLSLSLNRILGDATSFVLFAQNIWRAYRGEALPCDNYLQYLRKYTAHTHTAQYRAHGAWLAEQYGTPSYPLLPTQDAPDGSLPTDGHCTPWVFRPDYADRLADLSRREHVSPNAFFCLVTALAIMDYNGTDQAGLTWAYMGRETPEEMHIFGSLHRDIPFVITKDEGRKTKDEGEAFEQGILHSDYPFTLLSPAESPWHSAVNVLVQPSLAEAMEGCPAAFEPVPVERDGASYCMLDVDITLEPLTLTLNYSPRHYTEATIRRFADLIDQNARRLLGR